MKKTLFVLLALAFAAGLAQAEDKKPAKEKEKPAAKSGAGKNAAQKAESSIGEWADKHNVWKRSSSRKSEKK